MYDWLVDQNNLFNNHHIDVIAYQGFVYTVPLTVDGQLYVAVAFENEENLLETLKSLVYSRSKGVGIANKNGDLMIG